MIISIAKMMKNIKECNIILPVRDGVGDRTSPSKNNNGNDNINCKNKIIFMKLSMVLNIFIKISRAVLLSNTNSTFG